MIRFFGSSTCFEQLCAHPQVDGQLYEYNFWYNHSVLVAVRYIGRPLTQSDYTRRCIHKIVLLKMSTELLETCRGLKKKA